MSRKRFKFELGDKLQDVVTGFEGAAVSRTEALNGAVHYYLSPVVDSDGKACAGESIDECQLKKTGHICIKEKKRIGFQNGH